MLHTYPKFSAKSLFRLLFSSRHDFKISGFDVALTDMGRSAFRIFAEQNLKKGDEILLPAYICDVFVPILQELGIDFQFIDADPDTWMMDLALAKKAVTKKTKAVLVAPVYVANPDLMKSWSAFARQRKIKLVLDLAHGLPVRDRVAADFLLFSFAKFLPMAGGGALAAKNPITTTKIPRAGFGFSGLVRFLWTLPGTAFLIEKMKKVGQLLMRGTALGADLRREARPAFLMSDFDKKLLQKEIWAVPKIAARKQKAYKLFAQKLRKMGFIFPKVGRDFAVTFCAALVPATVDRDRLVQHLRARGILADDFWHDAAAASDLFPVSQKLAERIIVLPLQENFGAREVNKIVDAIAQFKMQN